MDIFFQSKKLEKIASDPRKCLKELGQTRAELFQKRLRDLYRAETLEDVRYLPGHYHELREDRKGQWGCDLDQPYRLIFEPHEDPIPTDENGKYVWIE
ncbi:MAG: killer suppression protein HigA [Mediterranea sp.]|nr:killer suppression protein HigA [Mediterranea sp.]